MALTQTAWCWIYTVPTCNLSLHEWCTTSREIIQVTRNWNLGLKIIVIFLQSKGFLKTIEKSVKNLLICRFCKSHILVANVSQFTNFAGRRLHNWFLDHKLSSNYIRSLLLWFSSKHSQHLSWWNLMQNEWKCQGFVTNCVLENDGSCRGHICWLHCSFLFGVLERNHQNVWLISSYSTIKPIQPNKHHIWINTVRSYSSPLLFSLVWG